MDCTYEWVAHLQKFLLSSGSAHSLLGSVVCFVPGHVLPVDMNSISLELVCSSPLNVTWSLLSAIEGVPSVHVSLHAQVYKQSTYTCRSCYSGYTNAWPKLVRWASMCNVKQGGLGKHADTCLVRPTSRNAPHNLTFAQLSSIKSLFSNFR